MQKRKDINKGISCNVRNCVYNERGCDCNLECVSISRGEGGQHFCKSFISLNDEESEIYRCSNSPIKTTLNIESGIENYFDFREIDKN